MDPDDEKRPITGEPSESLFKTSLRMYLVMFIGSSYCMYRMQNPWTESLSDTADKTGTQFNLITTEDASTGGLFVTVDDDDKVASHCWLHMKNAECTPSNAKVTCPCMLDWEEEKDVMCIRLADKLVSLGTFKRSGKGVAWHSNFNMDLCATEEAKSISELISTEHGKRYMLGKPDGVHFAQRLEFHGKHAGFQFPQFRNVKFDENFKILKHLGGGSSGRVEMCICMSNNKRYAIKIGTRRHGEFKEPSEVVALSGLRHKHIIEMPCAWREDDSSNRSMSVTYIVLECCNSSVASILPVSERNRKDELFEQLVTSMKYMHEKGVIHRDIKPENVLLLNNVLKLADFGQAATKSYPQSSFHGDKKYGSRGYAAPELTLLFQMHGEKVDVWSAGIFYYLIHSSRSGDMCHMLVDLLNLSQKAEANDLHRNDPLFDDWTGDYNLLLVMLVSDANKRISSADLLAMLVDRKSQG